MRRSRRWRGGRAPVLAIEKATADGHGFVGDELLSEDGSEEQAVVAATPVKQARAYPLNEQMLGRIRPKPMHEDNEVAFFLFSSLCYVLLWRCGGSGGGVVAANATLFQFCVLIRTGHLSAFTDAKPPDMTQMCSRSWTRRRMTSLHL